MSLTVTPNKQGLIRVFAVNRPATEMRQAIDAQSKDAIATELLGTTLPDNGFELFPAADLAGVGLAGYLSEGHTIPADQLAGARSKLDALDGYVLLVFSSAFNREGASLKPSADLTLIGTYGEAQPDMTTRQIDSEAAQPYTGMPQQAPATPPKSHASGSLVVAALIVLAGLILWWALA